MGFKQYTSCTPIVKHSTMNQYVRILLTGGTLGGILAGAVIVFTTHPWCALVAIPVFTAATQLAYCSWWLTDRLICLEELETDVFAVGMLISAEPPEKKTGFDAYDTDFSINLRLAHTAIDASPADVRASQPFGKLVSERPATHDAGLVFTGNPVNDLITKKKWEALHAEFEGGGVKVAFDGAGVALMLALAALAACAFVPPPWGVAFAVFLALIACLVQLCSAQFGRLDSRGSPADVGLTGALHPQDAGGTLFDVLAVTGRWVYDAGHNNEGLGWNEIHPIKSCNVVARWDGLGDWPKAVDEHIARGSSALKAATSDTTATAQQQPENRWDIHPLIDGCTPAAKPPDIR